MRLRLPRISDAKDHIITALVLLMAVSLMVSRHDGGLQNMRVISVTVLSYLEQPLSNIRVYRQALNTNTYLQRQNVLLQDELSRLRASEQENRILRDLLDFKSTSEYPLIPVNIVAKDLRGLNNKLTINAGTNQGVKIGMPLVNSDGLIGQVIVTAANFSQVIPYTNALFKVSSRIQDSRAYGIVSWQEQSYSELVMQFVPQTIQVEPGQIIETSGFSNQYPPHLPIGEVTRVVPQDGIETQLIYLRPFVDLHTVAEAFILQFTPDSTIQELIELQEELF
jgi:rod shape-determining protein MreC